MREKQNSKAAKHYAERDHEAQGTYYTNHVSAMTGEGLHAKSDIAAELAHRDIEIDRLRAALAAPAQAAPEPAADMPATWWALAMGAAASLEDAANCLRDVDAKKAALGAAKHTRDRGNELWASAHQQAAAMAAAPAQAGEYPELGKGSLWRDADGIRGYGADTGPGPWYTTADVHRAIDADRAARGAAQAAPVDGAEDMILAYLDNLKDDAAAHIYPVDLERCATSECTATVFSVRVGCPDGESVPLFSREQVAEAIGAARAAQKGGAV